MTGAAIDWLVTIGGACHLLQLPTMRFARRSLNWEAELAKMGLFNRQLVLTLGFGIVACVAGLGLLVMFSHGQLLQERAGRGLCAFLSVFWLARGITQWTLFSRTWPATLRSLHHFLCVFYPLLGVAYALGFFY